MIKSKIEAREKALELSVKSYKSDAKAPVDAIIATACRLYSYLVGECELPEQEPSAEELVNKTVDKCLESFNVEKEHREFLSREVAKHDKSARNITRRAFTKPYD